MDKYQFLQSKIEQIEHELNEIKRLMNQSLGYIHSDPESSLAKSRTILEKVLIDMYGREMSKEPQGLIIEKIIGETQFANKIQRNIVSRIRWIQNMGNIGVHHDFVTTEDALDTLDNVCTVFMWYLERYDLLVKREKLDTKILEKQYKKAQELHNQEKYSDALGVWDEIIQQVPEYWDARAERGYTLIKLERKNEAKEEALFILKQGPNNHHALTCLGWISLDEKDYENAIQHLNKAIQNNSNFARSYNLRGGCYARKKQYEVAIADYSKALEIDPRFIHAWYNRGYAKKDLGQYESAIADYSNALEIDPKYAFAWNNWGLAKYKLGQYESAIADYSKALEIDPNYVDAWNNRGITKYKLEKYESAIADYSNAISLDTGARLKHKHYWRAKAIIELWKPKIDNNGNPKEVLGHNQQIEALRVLRAEAVKNQQYEKAADLRDRESKLMSQAGKVDWNDQIAMCKEDLKKSQQLDLDASTLKEVNELLAQVNKYKHPLK